MNDMKNFLRRRFLIPSYSDLDETKRYNLRKIFKEKLLPKIANASLEEADYEVYSAFFSVSETIYQDIYRIFKEVGKTPTFDRFLSLIKDQEALLKNSKSYSERSKVFDLYTSVDDEFKQVFKNLYSKYVKSDFKDYQTNKEKECFRDFIFEIEKLNTVDSVEVSKRSSSSNIYETTSLYQKSKDEVLREVYESDITSKRLKKINSFSMQKNSYNDYLDQLMNPESMFLNNSSNKYDKYLNKIKNTDPSCDVIKSILYVSIMLLKGKGGTKAGTLYEKMLDRDGNWAVGGETETDPGFYGNSDMWKSFTSYYPFMEGKENPYKNLINNKEHKEMDRLMIEVHEWFKGQNLTLELYDVLFKNPVSGDKSIMDIIGTAKELFKVLESPLVMSSIFFNPINYLTGMISSLTSSLVTLLDFGLTGSMRKLFFVKIIEIDGNKYSLSDIFNYLTFIKIILETYNGGQEIETIKINEFINRAYETLGFDNDSLRRIGYCAFDKKLHSLRVGLENEFVSIETYESEMTKYRDGGFYTAQRCSRLLYATIQMGMQKRIGKLGNDAEVEIDYGNETYVRSLVKSLDIKEMVWLFKEFSINPMDFDEYFNTFSREKINNYNDKLFDITLKHDMFLEKTSMYESYLKYDKEILLGAAVETEFDKLPLNRYFDECLKEYFEHSRANKKKLANIMFSANSISNVDDFLLRMLPSFKVLNRTLGTNSDVSSIIKLIDLILTYMTDVLFRNFFLEMKNRIIDMLKDVSSNTIKYLEDEYGLDPKTGEAIDFGLGRFGISEILQNFMEKVYDNVAMTANIGECFINPDYMPPSKEWFDFDLKTPVVDFEAWEKDLVSSLEKVYYDPADEGIYGVTDKDEVVKLVDRNDEVDGGHITFIPGNRVPIQIPGSVEESVSRDLVLAPDVFEKLVQIKDFINNSKNITIAESQREITNLNKKIEDELGKKRPSMVIIKDLEKQKQELTQQIKDDKNKQKVFISGNEGNNLLDSLDFIELFDKESGRILSSTYETLEKVEEIVVENNLPLSNMEIISLLK